MKFLARDISGVDASATDGTAIVTFKGGDGKLELKVNIDMLLEAASFAQKERMRLGNIAHYGPEEKRGEWLETHLAAPTNWKVGQVPMFAPPATMLLFDHGTKWQIGYRLGPSDATAIGHALIAESARLAPPRPRK